MSRVSGPVTGCSHSRIKRFCVGYQRVVRDQSITEREICVTIFLLSCGTHGAASRNRRTRQSTPVSSSPVLPAGLTGALAGPDRPVASPDPATGRGGAEAGLLSPGVPPRRAAPSPPAAGDGAAPKRAPARGKTPGKNAARRAPVMPEDALQAAVIDLCKLRQVLWYHAYRPLFDQRGWPDLALAGKRGAMFRELKRDGENPTAEQAEWGRRLQAAGLDWDVWRPADLASGRILREIDAIR